jgi:hypothetical protein
MLKKIHLLDSCFGSCWYLNNCSSAWISFQKQYCGFNPLGIIALKTKIKSFEQYEQGTKINLSTSITPSPCFPYSILRDITNKRLHVGKHIWKQKGHVTTESWRTLIWCLENSWQLKVGVSLFSTSRGERERKGGGEREGEISFRRDSWQLLAFSLQK